MYFFFVETKQSNQNKLIVLQKCIKSVLIKGNFNDM